MSSPVQQQSSDADRQSSPPSLGAPASRVPPLTLGAADDTAGTPRIAPPERIPSRRFLSNGSFHHSPTGVAPAVPSSRPGTPRVTPAGSRSAFGESDGAQLTVQRNGGMSGSFAAPTNRPAPPRSRPPVESSPAQSPLFATTSVTTSPRGGPQSVVSEPPQQQLPQQQQSTALPAPVVSSSAANNGNRSQSQSHGRAASTDNSSFATFDPSSSAHAATKAATATSGSTAVAELQQQQQSKATPSPSTYTQPQQRSVSEAEAAEDEDDAYAPSKVVVDPKKAYRSGYADALASATLFFGNESSNAQNADAEEAAREVRRARRQQLDRERDEAMQRQQQIRRRNSAAADTDAAGVFFTNSAGSGGSVKSATTVHSNNAVGGYDASASAAAARASLTSPSRDFFGPLNTIDRRKLHEPVVCEKLFSYEEPASYSATNRDALAVPPRPSANSNANVYSNSGVRRRGAGGPDGPSADYYPAPVGMTLYEFRRDGSNAAGDGISNPIGGGFVGGAEEPYEGRNELVRQLREYELRQAHQEDLRRPSASTAGHGQYSNYAVVESRYHNNGYGSSSSQAARAGSAHPSAAAAADGYNNPNNNSTYFDVMYGEARQQQQQQQQMDHNNASGAAVMRGHSAAPINQSHHHHNYSTAATNRSLHRPPGAPIPSYGSTYADYAQGGEKIVRSFPSEWRVGPFPSGAPRGGSAAPFNNNNGGSGNLNRSQSQAMPLQQTPLAFRGPSQTSTLSRQQSVDRYGPRGSGDGAIAHRTPF